MNLDAIEPKTLKSNLNISSRKRRQHKISDEVKAKMQHDADVVKNADIIFGLDNGATRNNSMYS